mgnify:FL=1
MFSKPFNHVKTPPFFDTYIDNKQAYKFWQVDFMGGLLNKVRFSLRYADVYELPFTMTS